MSSTGNRKGHSAVIIEKGRKVPLVVWPCALCFTVLFLMNAHVCGKGSVAGIMCPAANDWIRKLQEEPCKRLGLSQGNQDCLIGEIFKHIGETNRFYVEYGFNTKSQCSGSKPNTCVLSKRADWRGLLLDANNENKLINLRKHPLFARNIVSIFQSYEVPLNLDYLSSDMDSHDYFVMRSIFETSSYRPRVISTEYNSNFPSDWKVALLDPFLEGPEGMDSYNFKFSGCAWGVSASAWQFLMERFGYRMVAWTPRLDLFWVRKDLLTKFNVPDFTYFSISTERQHSQLQSPEDLKHIVDVAVYESTKDVTLANIAALRKIHSNLLTQNPPNWCYSKLNTSEVASYIDTRMSSLLSLA